MKVGKKKCVAGTEARCGETIMDPLPNPGIPGSIITHVCLHIGKRHTLSVHIASRGNNRPRGQLKTGEKIIFMLDDFVSV